MIRQQKSPGKTSGLIRGSERGTRMLVALLGALIAVLAGYVALSKVGVPLVTLSYDMPFIVHRAGGADGIRMVFLSELDQQSLDRRPQAKLLDRLSETGAKMVVYDLIFDAPSKDPTVDQEFADAMRRFRGVDADGNPIPDAPRRQLLLGCARDTSNQVGHAMERLTVPIDILLNAADDFGVVAFEEDSYLIRKLTTGTRDEPSLAWKAAQAAGAGLNEKSRMNPRWVNFAGPPPGVYAETEAVQILSCDARSVISGGVSENFFRDKIVVIGGRPGIVGQELGKDLFSTPFHRFPIRGKLPYMSGVEVQANALANLMAGNWLERTSPTFDTLLIVVMGVLIGVGVSLLRPVNAIITSVFVTVASMVAGVLSVHYGLTWFPWTVVGFLQMPVALIWGIASNTYVERFFRLKLNEEQKAIRSAFAKYLSPQMLERLTSEGFHTKLGGESVDVAMMFTDIESFTDMCERVEDPKKIVETLNAYFERTTSSIFDHDGVVIKYIGDAIFAAWGAPLADHSSAVKAVKAAWRLFENDKLVVDGNELRTRIGLHVGQVVAGNVGSSKHVDYTLIGDAVNLTSRLEGLNKLLGTSILMSDSLRRQIDGNFRIRRIGTFRVKGRIEPVGIHELLGPVSQATDPDWFVSYHGALENLEKGKFNDALGGFTTADKLRGKYGDGPSRFFIERIRSGVRSSDGVIEITEK